MVSDAIASLKVSILSPITAVCVGSSFCTRSANVAVAGPSVGDLREIIQATSLLPVLYEMSPSETSVWSAHDTPPKSLVFIFMSEIS